MAAAFWRGIGRVQHSGFRFSLSWKVVGLISVLSMVLFATVAAINHRHLAAYFALERNNQHLLHISKRLAVEQAVADRLQAMSSENLRQMVQGGHDDLTNAEVDTRMSRFWSSLRANLPYGIEYLVLLDDSNRFVNAWGYYAVEPRQLAEFVAGATMTHTAVYCTQQCQLLVYVPFRFDTGFGAIRQIALVYGINLSSLLPQYEKSLDAQLLWLLQRGNRFELMNSPAVLRSPLEQALSEQPASYWREQPRQLTLGDRQFELRFERLSRLESEPGLFVAYLADVDTVAKAVTSAQRNNLIIAVLCVLAIQLVLLWVVSGPLTRVRRVIRLLPRLAESDYRAVIDDLATAPRQGTLSDESDDLAAATLQLAGQLQNMEQQLTRRAEELEWLTNHDPLTRLANRQSFERELPTQLALHRTGCLFFIDLDNFKYINDFSGHGMGDKVLVAVANMLTDVLSAKVLCARFGGDEFAFYLPRVSTEMAEIIGNRVLRALRGLQLGGERELHNVSGSLGIVAYPQHGLTIEQLLAKADLAMFQAKQKGKNCFAVYQSKRSELGGEHRAYWHNLVRRADEEERLSIVFQPLRHCASGRNSHYEVLLRYRDDDGQLISAYPLILAAEESGQISRIDLWVVRQALTALRAFRLRDPEITLAVNLSARSFSDDWLIRQLEQELSRAGELASGLVFEITETAALSNLQLARRVIEQLRLHGCRFALDDFGVGFSSFHSLKELPIDFIKIDGSFIKDLLHKPADRVFIRALVEIADHFGYRTVAEYVETEAQYELLKALGIDYCQGYHIGRPESLLYPIDGQRAAAG